MSQDIDIQALTCLGKFSGFACSQIDPEYTSERCDHDTQRFCILSYSPPQPPGTQPGLARSDRGAQPVERQPGAILRRPPEVRKVDAGCSKLFVKVDLHLVAMCS